MLAKYEMEELGRLTDALAELNADASKVFLGCFTENS